MKETISSKTHNCPEEYELMQDPRGRLVWCRKKNNSCFRIRRNDIQILTPSPAKQIILNFLLCKMVIIIFTLYGCIEYLLSINK